MKNLLYLVLIITIAATAGCRSPQNSDKAIQPGNSREAKLRHAVVAREKYLELLKNAKSVDDTIAAKNQLDDVQKEIDLLQGANPETGEVETPGPEFKNTKVIYGPLGLVVKGAGWLFRKFWIIYEE